MSLTGEPGRDPVRVGASLVDLGTAAWAALAVLGRAPRGTAAASDSTSRSTRRRSRCMPYQLTNYLATGEIPAATGTAFPLIAPYQVFGTRDGELMIVAGNDRLFRALCDVVGLPSLADDSRFATNPLRVAESGRADPIARAAFRARALRVLARTAARGRRAGHSGAGCRPGRRERADAGARGSFRSSQDSGRSACRSPPMATASGTDRRRPDWASTRPRSSPRPVTPMRRSPSFSKPA